VHAAEASPKHTRHAARVADAALTLLLLSHIPACTICCFSTAALMSAHTAHVHTSSKPTEVPVQMQKKIPAVAAPYAPSAVLHCRLNITRHSTTAAKQTTLPPSAPVELHCLTRLLLSSTAALM
jgi:hypothetical protein